MAEKKEEKKAAKAPKVEEKEAKKPEEVKKEEVKEEKPSVKRPKKKSAKWKLYEPSGKRKNTPCPKCGEGVFMAEHKNRQSCGNCGYTVWKK